MNVSFHFEYNYAKKYNNNNKKKKKKNRKRTEKEEKSKFFEKCNIKKYCDKKEFQHFSFDVFKDFRIIRRLF